MHAMRVLYGIVIVIVIVVAIVIVIVIYCDCNCIVLYGMIWYGMV